MKRWYFLAFLLMIVTSAFAEGVSQDSSTTRIKMSDIQYYHILTDDPLVEDEFVSDKPFALIQPNDKWFSKDKWMHLASSYFIVLQSGYAFEKMFYFDQPTSAKISVGISLSLSLGKELFDVFGSKSYFSWKDLAYDIMGSGLGYLTLNAINR